MRLPIGYDDFRTIREKKLDFVDKSLFIQEVLDDDITQVSVITRPRRFGKTFNLSMLHHFLASEVNGQPTQGLFEGLKISELGEPYMRHQGKYPVIFISFKDIKYDSYERAYENLSKLISKVYAQHRLLLTTSKLYEDEKEIFQVLLKQQATEANLISSLADLVDYLFRHYQVKPWLLVDEYDTPIQAAYVHGYYDKMIELMRGLLGGVLKSNPNLNKSIVTGILRVAKESLFSGINNIKICSLLQPEYSTHFGFTEAEVNTLLQQAHLEDSVEKIKAWYNGYRMGNTVIYNPWSIVNCIQKKGELAPYWVNTSDNQLIKELLINSDVNFKAEFESLLLGKKTEQFIDEHMVFGDLTQKGDAVWSLLLMAGYLKVVEQRRTTQGSYCTLDIPNLEVRRLYQQIIERWLANGYGIKWYNRFLESLLSGNIPAFEEELLHLMEQTASHHDMGLEPEAFYHGLMLGITASLYENNNYEMRSNRESGYGRYDYMILSRNLSKPTLIIELKQLSHPDKKNLALLEEKLDQLAEEALTQIKEKKYVAESQQRGIKNIIIIGLAFSGKRFKLKNQVINL